MITKNKVVHIHYTLKNDAGETLDSSSGQEPLAYLQGFGNLIPGLENALEGKATGDKFNISIPPQDAYGVRNDDLVQEIPLSAFDDQSKLEVGTQFQLQTEQGAVIATVTGVKEQDVVIDMNHPLADQTLHFDIEVGEIRDATPEEIEHGHVHGPNGHQH